MKKQTKETDTPSLIGSENENSTDQPEKAEPVHESPISPHKTNPPSIKNYSSNYVIAAIAIAVLLLLSGVSYLSLNATDRKETDLADWDVLIGSTSDELDQIEPTDDLMPIPTIESTITPTPVIVTPSIKPTVTTTNVTPTIAKAPANNKNPKVQLLSHNLETWTHNKDNGVQIIARASDDDGYISKVEIYVDGDIKKTILPYVIGGKTKTFLDDPEDIFDITEEIGEWIKAKENLESVGYIFRHWKEWSNQAESCGINEGFVHIFVHDTTFYDVRTSKNLKDNKICKKGDSINLEDLYYYLWNPKSGSHDTYAIAYDQYGAKTKSNKVEFKVE